MERLFVDDHWNAAASSFIDSIYNKSGSEASRSRYDAVLRAFFSDPARDPQSYSRQDVEQFLARPSQSRRNFGKPVGICSRNQKTAILASFFKYCSTYTVNTDGRPAALLERQAPTVGMGYGTPPKSYRALSVYEIEKLFAMLNGKDVRSLRDRCIYLWLLLSSKRRTEVSSLNWSDVSHGMIDGRESWYFTYRAKGSARVESKQELPEEVYNALIEYLEASGRLQTIKGDDPLFTSLPPRHGGNFRNVGKRLSGHAINENLKMLAIKCGITDTERISCHSLRHSSARLRSRAGQELASISRILGHKSIATTSHYLEDLNGVADPGLPMLAKSLPFLYHGNGIQ